MRAIWTRLAPGIAALALALASGAANADECNLPSDFVTGGGFIIPDFTTRATDAHANFGVAGGCKNGLLWGHLEYVDHGSTQAPTTPFRVHGTGVLHYFVDPFDPSTHWIAGTAEVNGVSGFSYCVRVTDNGQGASGGGDDFAIFLSNGYSAAGTLMGGNIQNHKPPNPDTTPKGTCPIA